MNIQSKDLKELDELTEEHLGFSALSEGLGFAKSPKLNEFKPSDTLHGMDKAKPSNINIKLSYGTGAIAAGPAIPAPGITHKTFSAVLAEPAASPFLRSSAFLLDIGFVTLPFFSAWVVSFRGAWKSLLLQDPLSPLLLLGVILFVYFLLSESFGGQSLGKMLLGIHIVEDDKYQKPIGLKLAVARLVLFGLGFAAAGIGLFYLFFDKKRRPLHDRYTNSIVSKINKS